jgi:predicted methyltransferase
MTSANRSALRILIMRYAQTFGIAVVLALAAGCGQKSEQVANAPPALPAAVQSDAPTAIAAALASTERLAGDADEDARRHPREVLEFLGIEPGMRVLDFLAGGGYYTELLSRVVGSDGTVIAYNDALFTKLFGERLNERLNGGRLANVKPLVAEANELVLEPGELDAALFVMSFHDLHHSPAAGAVGTDVPKVIAKVFEALKAGGIVLVQDHAATADAEVVETASNLHRIDPEAVKLEFTAAGFTFDGESPVFANPADDHSKIVFDPAIRGSTDRFMIRFRKPLPVDAPRTE